MFTLQTKGYTLVEVLVAISILLLAIVGPMTIAAKGLQSAYYARQQATALFLAQEAIEVVVASRNDALIEAIKAGTALDTAWRDWVVSPVFALCRNASGCNFDVRYTNTGTVVSQGIGGLHVKNCNSLSQCVMKHSTNQIRARYNLMSGSNTEYTRVVKFINETDRDGNSQNDGVFIEVTVSWSARVFNNTTQSVVLTSAVYSIYE